MPQPTFKDSYERQTIGGNDWTFTSLSSDNTVVIGQVLVNDTWINVDWILQDRYLKSRSCKEYDIESRMAPIRTQNISRSLDSPFIVSSIYDAFVFYTLELKVELLLAGIDEITVNLISSTGTVLGSVKLRLELSLGLGLSLSEKAIQQKILSAFVPRNTTVTLETVSNSGLATYIGSLEVLF